MSGFLRRFLLRKNSLKVYRKSYSQCGEDLILDFLFKSKGIKLPSYIDIGAHHSKYFSNTYFFYKAGSSGICIEPDATLYREIKSNRGRDICLNIGIGDTDGAIIPFFIMDVPTLNTFSIEEAKRMEKEFGHKIKETVNTPVKSINSIMMEYQIIPDFISIDVEGYDFTILKAIDLSLFRPKAFVIETLQYSLDHTGSKVAAILKYMLDKDYVVYADTWLNTIFVDKEFLLYKSV